MAKQDSGSKAHIFHQYIMLHPTLNHRGGIALEVYFCKGLTFYTVGVVENWATTNCFYRVKIAG